MDVEFTEESIYAGMVLRGRLTATFQDRVSVKLQTLEGRIDKPVTFAETHALAANGHTFELPVPVNALTPATDGPAIAWMVAASEPGITGHDMQQTITIVSPEASQRRPITDAELNDLVASVASKRQRVGNGEIIVVALFVLMGLGLLGTGIYTSIVPPDSFDDNRTPAFVMMAMSLAFFVPGYLRIRSVYRPATLPGVGVVSYTRSARPGEAAEIRLAIDPDDQVRVGLVTTSLAFAQLKPRYGSSRNQGGGYVQRVLHEQWTDASAASPTASFTVPPTAPPTYAGATITIAHHFRVQRGPSTSAKRNTRRLEQPLAVLP